MDIVQLYNPANAASLTAEQIAGLQNLTDDEIKLLAEAYPTNYSSSGYLLVIDRNKKNPIPTLSTFQILYNLRVKNAMKNIVAYQFKGTYKPQPITNINKRVEVLDLSETELMSLPGFKTVSGSGSTPVNQPPSQVAVKKIRKVPLKGVDPIK